MKVSSNLISDLIPYYKQKLMAVYSASESSSLLYRLFEHFFGISRIQLVKQADMRLSESEMLKLHFAVKDLLLNKPIQYITGKLEFLDLELQIQEGVLIPRPETEQLVQIVMENIKTRNTELSILDIGTGSACIPIALKHQQKDLLMSAIDVSVDAIELAKRNAAAHQLRIDFKLMDVFSDSQMESLDKFDIIISNPPYVRNAEKKKMQKNVLDYEPELALYVSDDNPLLYYERIARLAKDMLKQHGELYFEINEYLGEEIRELLVNNGYQDIQILKDFNGRDRFAHALK